MEGTRVNYPPLINNMISNFLGHKLILSNENNMLEYVSVDNMLF